MTQLENGLLAWSAEDGEADEVEDDWDGGAEAEGEGGIAAAAGTGCGEDEAEREATTGEGWEESGRGHPTEARHAGDHFRHEGEAAGEGDEPATGFARKDLLTSGVVLRSHKPLSGAQAETAAEKVGDGTREEGTGGGHHSAEEPAIDVAKSRHHRGRRDRQKEIANQQEHGEQPAPLIATAAQHPLHVFLRKTQVPFRPMGQKGNAQHQRQQQKKSKQPHGALCTNPNAHPSPEFPPALRRLRSRRS